MKNEQFKKQRAIPSVFCCLISVKYCNLIFSQFFCAVKSNIGLLIQGGERGAGIGEKGCPNTACHGGFEMAGSCIGRK